MGPRQFALTSTVAAVPALFLVYLLVMAFFNYVGNMSTVPMILAGGTLVLSFFIVVMPFGILIGGTRKKRAAAPKARKDEESATGDESVAEAGELSASGEVNVLDSDEVSVAEGSDVELDDTTAFIAPVGDSEEIELGDSDTFGTEEIEEVDEIGDEVILEEEDDEDGRPRKKRR